MKKRGIALLLALAWMLGCLPVQARAADGTKLAAITFDDGPGKYTDGLLDELSKRDVTVTFFMQGCNAEQYPAVVKKAYEAGHQIASHTYNHPQLTKLSGQEIKSQLSKTDSILNKATGVTNSYMLRPPYGSTNEKVLPLIGRPAVLWSVDTLDWQSRNADAVYQHIVSDTKDGSIVLLHDLYSTSVTGALRGIDTLLSQGYELVTVEELLRRRSIEAVSGKKYFSASGNTTLPAVSAPVITAAETENGSLVTLSADEGTTVYYTTDGTTPSSQSAVYTGPFPAGSGVTIKAFAAYTLNGGRSRVAECTLELPRAGKPVITLSGETAILTGGGEIHYTLDGTVPTAGSAHCDGPFPVAPGTLIQAVAVEPGCRDSLVSSLLYSGLGNLFSDVRPTDWFYHDVDNVVFQGLMTADDQAFSPEEDATRREIVTVLYRLAGQPEPGGTVFFSDTDGSAAVQWAAEQHVISGFEDGTFRPDLPVTREQLAVILYRMASVTTVSPTPVFDDWGSVQDYARDAVAWAVSHGILGGVSDTLLSPGSTVTRAQLASIVLRWQAV